MHQQKPNLEWRCE